jgi:hypothetical protein
MLGGAEDLLAVVARLYGEMPLPKSFQTLAAALRLRAGEPEKDLTASARTTAKRLREIASATDPAALVFGKALVDVPEKDHARARKIVGQLLVGSLAERAFEKLYRETMGTNEIHLEDERSGRNETDYRVLNGDNRPVFRINIKFHASTFRRALELVGLEPEDCFALATYKINQALVKNKKEDLNYIFVIVGDPELTGERVGAILPDDFIHLAALLRTGKRAFEEKVVEYFLGPDSPSTARDEIARYAHRIDQAEWRVISATKADKMLRTLLFERVYAVRVPRFAANYRNAEIDMHFSLHEDLTPLKEFLGLLKTRGLHGISTMLVIAGGPRGVFAGQRVRGARSPGFEGSGARH